ncbi:hypothetical protein CF326_g9783, partial [Tilletia indica]
MKQPTSEQAPRTGTIAQQSKAPAPKVQQAFGAPASASAKNAIRQARSPATIRPEVVVTSDSSTSASVTASSAAFPSSSLAPYSSLAPPSPPTEMKSPEAEEEDAKQNAEAPKKAMKYPPFKDMAEERKATKHLGEIRATPKAAEGKDGSQDADTIRQLEKDRQWAKVLEIRLQKTWDLAGREGESTLSPSVGASTSAPRTAGESSTGAPRVIVRGQRLQDSEDEAEKAPQSSDAIMVQKRPKKGKGKDKAQVDAPRPSASKLTSEKGPTSGRANISIPGRQRSGRGSGQLIGADQISVRKRPGMSMAGAGTTAAGKAAASAAGPAPGKTSTAVPARPHATGSTATTAGSGRAGGSGLEPKTTARAGGWTMEEWDSLFGYRKPDSLKGHTIPKEAVPSGGSRNSAGNGGQSSAVVDMRDADK